MLLLPSISLKILHRRSKPICRYSLASSALPHGVFPSIRIRGIEYVDGGMSDNLPVFAALEHGAVSHLTVVRLRPKLQDGLLDSWRSADRLLRLRNVDELDAQQSRKDWLRKEGLVREDEDPDFYINRIRPPQIIPYRDPLAWPEHVLEIVPSEDLGGLITGTLNFSRNNARRLINLGWTDCRRCLDNPSQIPEALPVGDFSVS